MPHGLRVLDRRVRAALQAQALRVATAGGTSRFNAGSSPSVDNVNKGTGLVYCNPKSIDQNGRFWQKGLLSGSSHHYFGTAGTGSGALEAGVFKSTASTNYACDVTADAPTYAAGKWCFVGYEWDTGGADTDQKIFHGDHGNPCVEASGYLVQTAGTGSIGNDASVDGFLLNNSAAATAFAGDAAVIILLKNQLLTLEELRIWQEMMELGPDALLNEPLPRRDSCVGLWFPGLDGTYFIPDYSGFGNHAYAAGAVMTLARGMPGWVRRPRVAVAAPAGGDITGAGAATLPLTGAATSTVLVQGAGAAALPVTGAATGVLPVQGAGAAALPFTGSSAGVVSVAGAGAASLPLAGAASGTVAVQGAGTAALPLTGSGEGIVGSTPITGDGAAALPLAGAASAAVAVAGAGAASLPLTCAGAGNVLVQAAGAAPLPLTGAATGVVGTTEITGAGAASLPFVGSGAAVALVAGSGQAALPLAGAAVGVVLVRGVGLAALPFTGFGSSIDESVTILFTMVTLAPSRSVAALAPSRTVAPVGPSRTIAGIID